MSPKLRKKILPLLECYIKAYCCVSIMVGSLENGKIDEQSFSSSCIPTNEECMEEKFKRLERYKKDPFKKLEHSLKPGIDEDDIEKKIENIKDNFEAIMSFLDEERVMGCSGSLYSLIPDIKDMEQIKNELMEWFIQNKINNHSEKFAMSRDRAVPICEGYRMAGIFDIDFSKFISDTLKKRGYLTRIFEKLNLTFKQDLPDSEIEEADIRQQGACAQATEF